MIKKILFSFFYVIFFIGCTKENVKINAVCELMPNGTYMIKWETFPPLEGSVKIYESNRPDSFNLNFPIAELDIKQGYKQVLAMPKTVRPYFNLVFNKNYSVKVTNRVVPMQNIFNFRDMGGYTNDEGKSLKWGKLYRSGSLAIASRRDMEVLHQLQIETIIDLRTKRENYAYPLKYQPSQTYSLPLRGNRYDAFFNEVLAQKMKRTDILLYDQNTFTFLLENNADYFIKMFDVLLEEKNYPIVIYCSLGKDRAAIASALIMAALNIDNGSIIDDYLLSNNLINYHSLIKNASMYPDEVQETITALFSAHKETIKNSFDLLIEQYGSMDNYFEKVLELTPRKREKLKEILLEKQY